MSRIALYRICSFFECRGAFDMKELAEVVFKRFESLLDERDHACYTDNLS